MVEGRDRAGSPGLEWFTRNGALQRAREAAGSPEIAKALAKVDGLLELVELGLEPPEEFSSGDPNDALLLLLSEAFRVIGVTHAALPSEAPFEGVAAAVDAALLQRFVPENETVDGLLLWLGEGRARAMDGLSVPEADERVAHCRHFVRAFALHVGAPRAEVRRLEAQRRSRPWWTVVTLLIALAMAVVAVRKVIAPRNLADGKTFTASSAFTGFKASGIVNIPVEYDVFVHTREEESPWLKLDLGAVENFRTIEIGNRTDCCRERLAPLVVEGSEDGEAWRELARRTDEFSDWTIALLPTKARYLRFTIPRRTYLHLARISVRH